MSVSFRL